LFFIYFIPYFSAPLDGEIDSGALDSAWSTRVGSVWLRSQQIWRPQA
jgi:hypothetical protein